MVLMESQRSCGIETLQASPAQLEPRLDIFLRGRKVYIVVSIPIIIFKD